MIDLSHASTQWPIMGDTSSPGYVNTNMTETVGLRIRGGLSAKQDIHTRPFLSTFFAGGEMYRLDAFKFQFRPEHFLDATAV